MSEISDLFNSIYTYGISKLVAVNLFYTVGLFRLTFIQNTLIYIHIYNNYNIDKPTVNTAFK